MLVRVAPEAAFAVFTEQIDQWWRRGFRYRVAGNNRGIIHIEGHVGGRLLETFHVGSETKVFETGTVTMDSDFMGSGHLLRAGTQASRSRTEDLPRPSRSNRARSLG